MREFYTFKEVLQNLLVESNEDEPMVCIPLSKAKRLLECCKNPSSFWTEKEMIEGFESLIKMKEEQLIEEE